MVRGEWMLALAGVLSIVFGGLLIAFPVTGALALVALIAAYAVLFGVLPSRGRWLVGRTLGKVSPATCCVGCC